MLMKTSIRLTEVYLVRNKSYPDIHFMLNTRAFLNTEAVISNHSNAGYYVCKQPFHYSCSSMKHLAIEKKKFYPARTQLMRGWYSLNYAVKWSLHQVHKDNINIVLKYLKHFVFIFCVSFIHLDAYIIIPQKQLNLISLLTINP